MQIEVTRKTAETFMRWFIVLTLFGAFIFQSSRIKELQLRLDSKTMQYDSLHKDWASLEQEAADYAKSCQK